MAYVLALSHHLRTTHAIPVAAQLDYLRILDAAVLFERIDSSDESLQEAAERCGESYPDCDAQSVEAEVRKRFHVADRLALKDGKRELLALTPL